MLKGIIAYSLCVFASIVRLGQASGGVVDANPPFTPEEFATRRERVFDALGGDLAVIGGADPTESWRPFRQHNDFYYLTGLELPNLVLVLDGATKKAVVFAPAAAIRPHAIDSAHWMGIEQAESIDRLAERVKNLAAGRSKVYVPRFDGEGNAQSRDLPRNGRRRFPFDRRPSRIDDFRAGLKELIGDAALADLEGITDPLRLVKSPAEIAVMRTAGRIGAEAIAESIRATRPGIIEGKLAGICEMVYARHGAYGSAWTPIVASGPNIIDFHYMANRRTIQAGDMILLDAGPDYHYYTSDITRVWPATGPYPPRYRELYDKLLVVHQKTVAAVRPGATMADLTRLMMAAAREQGIGEFVIPQAGHYTGMAPHDVGGRGAPFVPGVVFNVEPLLLISAEKLHIRFEDTVLCTSGDPEVFTPLDVLPWEADRLLQLRDTPLP